MIRNMLSLTSLFVISSLGFFGQQTAEGQITSPADYLYLTSGTDQVITWNINGESHKTVMLQYSTDGGATWDYIGSCGISARSYDWVIPVTVNSWNCKVRIQEFDGNHYKTFASTGVFSIKSLDANSGYQEVFSHRHIIHMTHGSGVTRHRIS